MVFHVFLKQRHKTYIFSTIYGALSDVVETGYGLGCAEKLTPENSFIFSEHTVSTTAIIHFFTKSPSVNGLLSFAVNCATL